MEILSVIVIVMLFVGMICVALWKRNEDNTERRRESIRKENEYNEELLNNGMEYYVKNCLQENKPIPEFYISVAKRMNVDPYQYLDEYLKKNGLIRSVEYTNDNQHEQISPTIQKTETNKINENSDELHRF